MKRFAPLLLIVLALAAVPVAFADDTTPAAPAAPAAPSAPATPSAPQGHAGARIRLELLRVRLELVRIRYQLACHDKTSDRCTQFTQKVVDGLTTLDGNVQKKMTDLNCTSGSSDKRCDVLSKIDSKLQDVIQRLQSPSSTSTSSGGDESGLDNAAASIGSTNP
jgi:hypothetical protein